MIRADTYIVGLRYDRHSVEPPRLNCLGLWIEAVRRERGDAVLEGLPDYVHTPTALAQMRSLKRQADEGTDWAEVPEGEEADLDLVLMRALAGRGSHARLIPLHCGCVIGPGRLMHIEDENGVLVKQFRTANGERTDATMFGRVLGVYRWRGLQC
jgi:hypothetical protein